MATGTITQSIDLFVLRIQTKLREKNLTKGAVVKTMDLWQESFPESNYK